MPTNTSGGTTTSLNNTPQAVGDTFYQNEDFSSIALLDVMSNDLGGNAKILWSLDDTASDGSADLIASDIGMIESTTTDLSAHGAKIWIQNGKVAYDAATLDAAFKASLQALGVGETITDSFTYAIRMSNGTLSWTTATIVYSGTNDGPDISLAGTDSAAKTLIETNAALSASGTLTVVDPDASDTVGVSVTNFSKSGNAGSLTDAQLQAMLSLGASTLTANAGETHNLGWAFNSGLITFDYLAAGQSLTLTYTVSANDGHGGTDTQQITVTINGTNDAAVISAVGGGDYSITEAGGDANADLGDPNASGQLTVSDVDTGEGHFEAALPTALQGTYGSFTFNAATGNWTYTLDNTLDATQALNEGDATTDTLTVFSHDGTSYNVVVNITGTNDDPVAVADTNSATEGGSVVLGSVALNDSDPDDGASLSYTLDAPVAGQTLGLDGGYSFESTDPA
jgi:VCBS repeat-containing protein